MLFRILLVLTVGSAVCGIENVKPSGTVYNTDETASSQSLSHSVVINEPRSSLRFEEKTTLQVKHPVKFEDNRIDNDDHTHFQSDTGQIKFINNHQSSINNDNSDFHFKGYRGGRKIKFEEQRLDDVSIYDDDNNNFDQNDSENESGKDNRVRFNDDDENPSNLHSGVVKEPVVFQDDRGTQESNKKRKGRRRPRYKKPKHPSSKNRPEGFTRYGLAYPYYAPSYPGNQYAGYSDYPNYPGYPAPYPGYVNPENPSGFTGQLNADQSQLYSNADYQARPGQIHGYVGYNDPAAQYYQPGYPTRPDYPGQHRPSRRPKSLASQAVSAVVEALTSIAMYDDYQCVPRLLCEAAGSRATGSSTVQTAVSGLQPLITMLSAYNGASSSPLFIFGRAVILGATSKGNTASCRYAYPQCPTDPEQLIYYLNNHNGGFFRFFNSPQQQTQNVEQFYNQLAGQYGAYNPNGNQQGFQNLYDRSPNYGSNDGYAHNKYEFQNAYAKEIQDRIQNKPTIQDLEDDLYDNEPNSKWLFPDETYTKITSKRQKKPDNRDSKTLKFPEEYGGKITDSKDRVRKGKTFLFPGQILDYISSYFQYPAEPTTTTTTTPPNLDDDYYFDHKYNFYVKKEKQQDRYRRPATYNNVVTNDGLTTVYIVRGNGDPNHPEVVKVRPGQSIQSHTKF